MVSCLVQDGIHCFWLTGNGKKVSTAFWHGKGLLVSTALTGMERDYWYPLPWLAWLERWQTVRGCQLVRRNRMEGWDRCWHQREGTNQARRMVEEVLVQVESGQVQSLGLVGLQLA